ncbi:OB-fold nucleic acid binding domain-containing protein [Catellatospora tritici]|uniref:OB-fold nucleic acid binding domain-containing protein n=1 Tax=Catellatospora tritici TaxID=2851566 RepID=UPI001C2D1834|nr:OB-fold nucleic acid binding domain-containing protein [Catellatospora tritici]MBV1851511.1 OB-fold nucleic acid binding domain-containing protein [Catellatospora tritici]
MSTDEPRQRPRGLRGMLHRLTASDQELESEELRRDSERAGCVCADTVGRGDLVNVTGRLRTVVYTPRTNLPTLEADLYDGTDLITLVFLGRRHINGIEPGRGVHVRGRVALRDGRKVIFNPYYELEAAA